MIEIWKDIIGYEGIYQVSNLGRIKIIKNMHKGNKTTFMEISPNRYGYCRVSLWKNKKRKTYCVHRLVAEAFIPNPENKPQVNHKDGQKSNNDAENLEWATSSENQTHSCRVLGHIPRTFIGRFGKLHPRSKKVKQIKDGKIIAVFDGIMEASRITSINKTQISNICQKKKGFKTAGGYIWEFATKTLEQKDK